MSELIIPMPAWLCDYESSYSASVVPEERMSFVIRAARENIFQKTGGPFAAAIFERGTGKLLSIGVNLVTSIQNSVLHAEIVAIMMAQKRLKTFNLGQDGLPEYELVSSSSPCSMCIGAINWSGVSELLYGASVADACAIGFDEGPISDTWVQAFNGKGIAVAQLSRSEANEVLQLYSKQGGEVYNGGSDDRAV